LKSFVAEDARLKANVPDAPAPTGGAGQHAYFLDHPIRVVVRQHDGHHAKPKLFCS
jgi:hypothetical protein